MMMVGEAIFSKGLGGPALCSLCGQGGKGVRRGSILLRERAWQGHPVPILRHLHRLGTSPPTSSRMGDRECLDMLNGLVPWVLLYLLDSEVFGLWRVLDTSDNSEKSPVTPLWTEGHA